MNARPRRNAPKPFVTGGIIMNPNRPLIVPPHQQQVQQQLSQQISQLQQQKSQQQQQQQQVQQQIQKQPQQQQQQQQVQQQIQQQPQQQQSQQQQQQPQQQQIQPIQQITKNESISIDVKPIPVIGAGVNANSNGTNGGGMNYEMVEEEMNKKAFFKKFLGSRKKASVRAKERRLRQNKRLRKVLVPKNALMALHELRGIKISEFNVMTRSGGGFVCQVTVNNIQYEGFGISKANAKSDACEKALRDLFISKMLQKPSKISTDDTDSISTTATTETVNPNIATEDKTDDEDIEMKICENSDEDDLPMINLASYALFKLFSEWENEGFEIPEFRSNSSLSNTSQQGDTKKTPTIRTELPSNWESLHPAMLLCTMRPGSTYTDLGTDGLPPNQIQRVGITIDGEHFIGVGRSKKAARKDAAINACNQIFGTTFPKDQ